MFRLKLQRFIIFCLIHLGVFHLSAQEKFQPFGFIDPNIYYDTRGFSTLTINTLYQINSRLQYFGFFNNDGVLNAKSTEVNSFYSEHNLRYQLNKTSPLLLTNQNVLTSGLANDQYRIGLMWDMHKTKSLQNLFNKLHLTVSINLHALQWNFINHWEIIPQLEYVFKKTFFGEKMYWFAFCDQNFFYHNKSTSFKWVTEHQIGIKLTEQLFVVTEFRLNTFNSVPNQTGVGFGLEYLMTF